MNKIKTINGNNIDPNKGKGSSSYTMDVGSPTPLRRVRLILKNESGRKPIAAALACSKSKCYTKRYSAS